MYVHLRKVHEGKKLLIKVDALQGCRGESKTDREVGFSTTSLAWLIKIVNNTVELCMRAQYTGFMTKSEQGAQTRRSVECVTHFCLSNYHFLRLLHHSVSPGTLLEK